MRFTSLIATLALCSVAGVLALGTSCSRDPMEASLNSNLGETFAQCNPQEIRFLSGKHNFQLAFGACGKNAFDSFAWSPDGIHLYFQLTMTPYVMNGDREDKAVITVPTAQPVGGATWLTPSRLAVPVVAAEKNGPLRMAVFGLPPEAVEGEPTPSGYLQHYPLEGYTDISTLEPGPAHTDVLFLATGPEERRTIYRLDTNDGTVHLAYPWLEGAVERFSTTPEQDVIVLGNEGTVELRTASTGEVLGSWSPALGGSLHKEGRWLMLEHEGAEVSPFYQRTWNELSEPARRREQARAKRFESSLPDSYVKVMRPPTLSVVDRETNTRWEFTSFLGHQFEWYEAYDLYGSFMLWGFEGKQLQRNVALGNLRDRLDAISEGRTMLGVQPFVDPDAPPQAPAPDDGEGSPDPAEGSPAVDHAEGSPSPAPPVEATLPE